MLLFVFYMDEYFVSGGEDVTQTYVFKFLDGEDTFMKK